LVGITPQRPRFDTVRAAVRLAFRAHICGLVPASDVNWLVDVRPKVLFQAFGQVSEGARGRYSLWRFRTLL
jgi:hypothetical protein